MLMIGIDCGTNTGIAAWDGKKLTMVKSMPIHKALEYVKQHKDEITILYCENPFTWKPFGKKVNYSKLQGAGSIKRDFRIWEDFCKDEGITFRGTKLQGSLKKLSASQFQKITGWFEQTNEHGRDAAMIVYKRKLHKWTPTG